MPGPFLTAEWRVLAMLNYEIDPEALAPLVPAGTELDSWQGRSYASLVGFRFLDTRVLGIPIPLHRDFEEVNLRFYVRRRAADGWRRGVVFVKEIVPRFAIAFVARRLYNENYVALPMRHELAYAAADPSCVESVAYAWHTGGREHRLSIGGAGAPQPLVAGSEAAFIAEHYWGYTRQRDGSTVEYRVEHPPWRVATAARAELHCDVRHVYGDRFAKALRRPASSAFLAEGSAISVSHGARLRG